MAPLCFTGCLDLRPHPGCPAKSLALRPFLVGHPDRAGLHQLTRLRQGLSPLTAPRATALSGNIRHASCLRRGVCGSTSRPQRLFRAGSLAPQRIGCKSPRVSCARSCPRIWRLFPPSESLARKGLARPLLHPKGRSCRAPEHHDTARLHGACNEIDGAHIAANQAKEMVAAMAT